MKKKIYSIGAAFLLIITLRKVILQTQLYQDQPTQQNLPRLRELRDNNIKTILYWNSYFDMKHFSFGIGQAPFEETGCPVTNCVLWDKQDGLPDIPYEEFDAVLFHALDTSKGSLLSTKPLKRLARQRYVFFLLESPAMHVTDFTHLNGFFNWTFTYRQESDIYFPYGWFSEIATLNQNKFPSAKLPLFFEPNYQNERNQLAATIPGNKKLAAWVVSNCATESKREWYVAELSHYIDIDIYGSCGTFSCDPAHCDTMLENNYKFYLAFENSLCADYVTEKFFRTMQYNIVPVVYGAAEYRRIAPPMSYIDVGNYKNPKDLADYLLYLDKNPEKYEQYLRWKLHYSAHRSNKHSICQLCDMLNNPNLPSKVYHNLDSWWNWKICQSPNKFFQNNTNWVVSNIGKYFHSMHLK